MKNQIFIWNCSIFKLTCIFFIRKCVICSICFAIKYLIEKNFHFTVFSCLYENDKKSFSSVCFTVKWKKKNSYSHNWTNPSNHLYRSHFIVIDASDDKLLVLVRILRFVGKPNVTHTLVGNNFYLFIQIKVLQNCVSCKPRSYMLWFKFLNGRSENHQRWGSAVEPSIELQPCHLG